MNVHATPPHGRACSRDIVPAVQLRAEECADTLLLLAGPHHIDVDSGIDLDRGEGPHTVIGCAREAKEPLPRAARRTELIGLRCRSPDKRTAAGP